MQMTIQKADKVLNKLISWCAYAVSGIMVICILVAIVGTIWVNFPEFMRGMLEFCGILAGVVLIVVLCTKYAVFRIIVKTILAVAGMTLLGYILVCLARFIIGGA
jgi:hypothetical protein